MSDPSSPEPLKITLEDLASVVAPEPSVSPNPIWSNTNVRKSAGTITSHNLVSRLRR